MDLTTSDKEEALQPRNESRAKTVGQTPANGDSGMNKAGSNVSDY